MAVNFSLLPPEEPEPDQPPSRLVWTIVFFVLLLASAAAVIMLWAKDMPTRGWQFWTCLVVLPASLASFVVSRRFSAYEALKLDVAATNETSREFNDRVFTAARNPLSLLACAFRFSADDKENNIDSVSKTLKLNSRDAIASGGEPVKARWLLVANVVLKPGEERDDVRRHKEICRWLYAKLLQEVSEAIRALPPRIELTVQFATSILLSDLERDSLWKDCWADSGLRRRMKIEATKAIVDLNTLDVWLDENIKAPVPQARLIVAVQLNPLLSDSPSAGGAEAGVVLLLMPMELVRRHNLVVPISLYRPVRAAYGASSDALVPALKWAHTHASDITDGWQTGFSAEQWGEVCSQDALLGPTRNVIKIDLSIGYAGVAAPWLAIGCAAKSLSDEAPKQVVFSGSKSTFDCAVLVRSAVKDVPA
jgi:hypothetical protein